MQSRVEDNISNKNIIDEDSNDLWGLFNEGEDESNLTNLNEATLDPSNEEENDFGSLFSDSENSTPKDPSDTSNSSEEASSDSENAGDVVAKEVTHTKDHFMNNNGLLSCYNMVPSAFSSLAEMTHYLDTVKEMGFNTIWINPIQEAVSTQGSRTDKLNMQKFSFAYSLYAMKSIDIFDQRIATVKRDDSGNYLFTSEQIKYLMGLEEKQLENLFKISSKDELKLVINNENNKVARLKETYAKEEIALKHDIVNLTETIKVLKADLTNSIASRNKVKLKEINQSLVVLNNDLKSKEDSLASINFRLDAAIRQSQAKQFALAQYFDKQAIVAFTDRAKSLGITPIFDLVLNHVGLDSPLVTQYPHWFSADDVFQDVARFNYRKVSGEDNFQLIDEVIEKLWKPYIRKYIVEYGFEGARIDCVRRLPFTLREEIYGYIREVMKELNKPYPPVLLEELLFSDDKPLKEVIPQLGDAGGTHITGSVFYKKREWHGGIPQDIQDELGLKASIVSQGVINFTGNHDHTPAANEIMMEMAHLRKDADKGPMRQQFIKITNMINIKRQKNKDKYLQMQAKGELKKSDITNYFSILDKSYDAKIKYFQDFEIRIFANEIKREIIANPQGDVAKDFLIRMRDKITLNMFAGSGGFYLLCGDEVANIIPREIYLRENGAEVYPQKMHTLLIMPLPNVLDCLKQMAIEILGTNLKGSYNELAAYPQEQKRLLNPVMCDIINKINAGEIATQNVFAEKLKQYDIIFDKDDYLDMPRNSENLWNIIDSKFNLQSFIKEQNEILKSLPAPTKGTWTHSFKLEENFIVTVRINDFGYAAPAHLILTNLHESKVVEFGLKELKKVASYFQQRCYPAKGEKDYYEQYASDPGFAEAWKLILSSKPKNNPVVYCNSGIEIDSSVSDIIEMGYEPKSADNNKNYDPFFVQDTTTLEDILNQPSLLDLLEPRKAEQSLSNNNNDQNDKGKQKAQSKLRTSFSSINNFFHNLRSSFNNSSNNDDENNCELRSLSNRS